MQAYKEISRIVSLSPAMQEVLDELNTAEDILSETSQEIRSYLEEHTSDFQLFTNMFTKCTALVCYNDTVSQAILDVLDKIEGDISVRTIYSFDRHLPLHSARGIETYSLGYPKDTIGEIIGQKLLDMIAGKETESEMLSWNK